MGHFHRKMLFFIYCTYYYFQIQHLQVSQTFPTYKLVNTSSVQTQQKLIICVQTIFSTVNIFIAENKTYK